MWSYWNFWCWFHNGLGTSPIPKSTKPELWLGCHDDKLMWCLHISFMIAVVALMCCGSCLDVLRMLLFESWKALDFDLFAIAFVNFPSYNKRIENESWHFRYFISQVRVSESYGLKFPREFALLMKQLLYFDRYTRLLAPSMNMLRDERINISTNRQPRRTDRF